MLVASLPPRRLGVPVEGARLHFGRADAASGGGTFRTRYLYLEDDPAFELSLWCGTCPFLFERQGGANGTLSAALGVMAVLEGPLEAVDDQVLAPFASLLPEGEFLPLLLEVRPELVAPHDDRDYFSHEQVTTWGTDRFWGLPENPRSFYYRTFETAVSPEAHLYEFVVPLVPPGWNDRVRVTGYRSAMARGVVPTAVALSTLDVCQPATYDESADHHAHWGLTHFLLDGHHKLEAAARSGAPVRLLALVSVDGSLASADDLARLPDLLSRPRGARPAT
ncbi:hypothetical protein QE364_000015 [Nocardioides zeae]|uniref:Uncharacterized protein n=1 Tax=Nocardioides zeae TaxID=1457234 RepID=A0ACC6ICP3_9ACTN|nr:hypothetical protein [Nocardioides zeae]MDR6175394.1 hypothetical protein [Nocardioides zeae]MDR6208327.1 hypothetical protein [Nocardioides zeae]